jgi:3'(2'), 5'-bisphosphate nucleotidase
VTDGVFRRDGAVEEVATLEAWVPRVCDIAREAGERILEIYNSGAIDATVKADDSPLTAADLAAHRLIVQRLAMLTPELPVLSEESSDIAFDLRRRWRSYWLVDPLDGTKEFLSRNGQFTVNIALVTDGRPRLGVVHVPVTETTYWGVPGAGACRRSGSAECKPIGVSAASHHPIRIVGSRSHAGSSLDGFLSRVGAHDLLSMGSSLKFCLIAEGSADVYPRLGLTSEWDTAAAQAVVEAAGGEVRTLDGERLAYNHKDSLLNPHFVVYGDRSRDWLSLLR